MRILVRLFFAPLKGRRKDAASPCPSSFWIVFAANQKTGGEKLKTKYFVWEDVECDGINPNWQELTGREFLALVRSAKVAGRYFVKLENAHDGTATVIEATRASYLAWKKEENHREYLKGFEDGISAFSYHSADSDDGGCGEGLEPPAYWFVGWFCAFLHVPARDKTILIMCFCCVSFSRPYPHIPYFFRTDLTKT
jgi:hypothetical protein